MFKNKCACCGNYTIEELFEICEVCFWQNEGTVMDIYKVSGANGISILKARQNFVEYGSMQEEFSSSCRNPFIHEIPENNLGYFLKAVTYNYELFYTNSFLKHTQKKYAEGEKTTRMDLIDYSSRHLFLSDIEKKCKVLSELKESEFKNLLIVELMNNIRSIFETEKVKGDMIFPVLRIVYSILNKELPIMLHEKYLTSATLHFYWEFPLREITYLRDSRLIQTGKFDFNYLIIFYYWFKELWEVGYVNITDRSKKIDEHKEISDYLLIELVNFDPLSCGVSEYNKKIHTKMKVYAKNVEQDLQNLGGFFRTDITMLKMLLEMVLDSINNELNIESVFSNAIIKDIIILGNIISCKSNKIRN